MTLCLAIAVTQPLQGKKQNLPISVARDISPGTNHEYAVQARAGDLVAGTLVSRGAPLSASLHDHVTSEGRPLQVSSAGRIGFIASSSGTYRLKLALIGTQQGSYTLSLNPPLAPSARMRDVHVQPHDSYQSERLVRLARDVQAKRIGGVEQFWDEVHNAGGYLIEPLRQIDQEPGRPPDDVLVTFFWKATYETYNVLFSWFGSARAEDYYMSHLAGTNVWYKTLRVYRDSRFSYTLSPNDSPDDRVMTSQLDPGNPISAYEGSVSVFQTEDAPVDWSKFKPRRSGEVEEKRFESALLKGSYPAWIYTPPGYADNGDVNPLVILFDGAGYAGNFDRRNVLTPTMLDNLIDQGRMRPTVVCFLGGFRESRGLAPHNETSSDAVATELVPFLKSLYAISSNPRDVVIGGYSAGGTKASLIALKYPAVFGNVLSQSGAFRGPADTYEPNFISRLFVRAERVPVRFYLDAGLYDPGGSVRADDESNTAGNRHFRDVLQAKGYEVVYRETGGAHEFVHFSATLAQGLMALLNPIK